MHIDTYLHYNNVALVDPSEEFHASCIKQFNTKGYLTPNQLLSLRNWAHSTSTIERLTANVGTREPVGCTTETAKPAVVAKKSSRWTAEDVVKLIELLKAGESSLEKLGDSLHRSPQSVQNAIYRNAASCTIKKGKVIQFDEIPF